MKKKILFLCIAFVLLFFALAANNEFELLGDTQDYLAMSQSFIENNPLQDPSRPFNLPLIMHPPLYSVFLAAFFSLFGFSYFGAKIVSILFGILSIVALYFLLKKINVNHPELILVAFSTSIVFLYQANRILSDTVFMLFSLIAIYFILEYEKKQNIINLTGIVSGIFLALSFYARVAVAPLMIAIALYFLLGKKWKKAVFVSIIFGLIALPWLLFFANSQFFQPPSLEQPASYINWATSTWGENQSGPIEIVMRLFYNIFYFVFEGIPKTVFPLLLPFFFYFRASIFLPLFYLAGGIVFFFFSKAMRNQSKNLFVLYIIIYVLLFSIQPALDDVTFVDRYLFALFPFFLILLDKAFQGSYLKEKIAIPIFLLIIVSGAFFSIGYAITLEERMLNENYVGLEESIVFIKENIEKNELVVFHAPIHLYLNTQNKGTKNPLIAEEIGANYVLIDGWTEFEESEFEDFKVVFESTNGTSKVLQRKN